MINSTWLPESATEWIASASIDEEPLSPNAMNLVAAMPRLAPSAARMARVPPELLNPGQLLHLRYRRHRHRLEAVPEGEVDRGEVGHRDQRGEPLQRRAALRGEHGQPDAAPFGDGLQSLGAPLLDLHRLVDAAVVIGQPAVVQYHQAQPGVLALLGRVGEDVPAG